MGNGTGTPRTRDEKIDVLSMHDAAVATGNATALLEALGIAPSLVAAWRAQREDGSLQDDDERRETINDDSILRLAVMFRSMITQLRVDTRIPAGAAASAVVYSRARVWRADSMARARSALRSVLDAVASDPEAVMGGIRGVTAADAIAQVRAYVGVDAFPDDGKWSASDRSARTAAERDAQLTRLRRWLPKICHHSLALSGLRDWYRASPYAFFEPRLELDGPRIWSDDPETWPPADERGLMLEEVQARIGDLPDLNWVDDRHLEVLRRRTAVVHSDYIRDGRGHVSLKWHWQHNVVRPWLRLSMEDLRHPAERGERIVVSQTDRSATAAIASMAFYTAIVEWDPAAMQQIVKTVIELNDIFGSGQPEWKYRQRALAHRRAQSKLPVIAQVRPVAPPQYIRNSSTRVQELFQAADLLKLAPVDVTVRRYLETRRRIPLIHTISEHDRRVVQLCDYSANLSTAPRAVRRRIPPAHIAALKHELLKSAGRTGAYSASIWRNDALGAQGDHSRAQSLTLGRTGLRKLTDPNAPRIIGREREHLEMRQQLELNVAGSSVQWLEHLLSGDDRWLKGVDAHQWLALSAHALGTAGDAVAHIEELHADGALEGARYDTGYLADKSFLYRAYETYYRCACAVATVTGIVGLEEFGDQQHLSDLLLQIHRGATTVPLPIPGNDMPRLLHAMLWHTFLSGGVLPALQPDDVNETLVVIDAVSRPLHPHEVGDLSATTMMTLDRISLVTDWLISKGWSAGAIGAVAEDSRVWRFLDDRSGGLYSLWRNAYKDGELLLRENERSSAAHGRQT